MKNKTIICAGIIIFMMLIVFLIRSPEDDWIKDEKGIYIKHGNPSKIPDYVSEQQEIIRKAIELYNQKRSEGLEFSSQCLGTIENYAIDMAHVPRTAEDNLPENQCENFRNGLVSHFIELNSDGEIIRIF